MKFPSQLVAILLATSLSGTSITAMSADSVQQGKGDDAKRQEMFTKMKQMHLEGIQGRIAVLQTAQTCVNAATNHDQMKACHEQEKKSMEALRDKQKSAMESMRPADGKKN